MMHIPQLIVYKYSQIDKPHINTSHHTTHSRITSTYSLHLATHSHTPHLHTPHRTLTHPHPHTSHLTTHSHIHTHATPPHTPTSTHTPSTPTITILYQHTLIQSTLTSKLHQQVEACNKITTTSSLYEYHYHIYIPTCYCPLTLHVESIPRLR